MEATAEAVNAERERRIKAGCAVELDGVTIPMDLRSPDLATVMIGVLLRVADGDMTTSITLRGRDNRIVNLEPREAIRVWKDVASYIESVYRASWALKDSKPIPEDFADDKHWPSPNL